VFFYQQVPVCSRHTSSKLDWQKRLLGKGILGSRWRFSALFKGILPFMMWRLYLWANQSPSCHGVFWVANKRSENFLCEQSTIMCMVTDKSYRCRNSLRKQFATPVIVFKGLCCYEAVVWRKAASYFKHNNVSFIFFFSKSQLRIKESC